MNFFVYIITLKHRLPQLSEVTDVYSDNPFQFEHVLDPTIQITTPIKAIGYSIDRLNPHIGESTTGWLQIASMRRSDENQNAQNQT